MSLTTFQKLNNVLLSIASAASMGAAYPTWSDEFARKEVRERWNDKKFSFAVTAADFATMTKEEKNILGFALWDVGGPWLIPLWAWNWIADGEKLTTITGATFIKGERENTDLDVRFGCLAFGFVD